MGNLRRHHLPCFWSVACPLTGADSSYWYPIAMTPGRVAAHGIHLGVSWRRANQRRGRATSRGCPSDASRLPWFRSRTHRPYLRLSAFSQHHRTQLQHTHNIAHCSKTYSPCSPLSTAHTAFLPYPHASRLDPPAQLLADPRRSPVLRNVDKHPAAACPNRATTTPPPKHAR
jgi:hypothetical protein